MESDRRSFLRAASSSLVLGAGSVRSASAAAQAPAAPVSFPGIANPLEGAVEVIATGYIWTEGPVWVGGEQGHLLFSDVPGNAIYIERGGIETAVNTGDRRYREILIELKD